MMYTYSGYNMEEKKMGTTHVNITIPDTLKKELDAFLCKIKMKRSTFIQEAISHCIRQRRIHRLAKNLEESYKLMASENKKISEEWLDLEEEAI